MFSKKSKSIKCGMKKVIKYLFLYRVVMLFLTWYGKVMIWIKGMYYKSLRSRVMFEKSLWKKNLNLIKIQKKFYCNNLYGNEIYIKSKLNKELKKIDLQKEIEKFNKEIDLNILIEDLEYYRNFKGFIIVFDFMASAEKFLEKELTLGIMFFNSESIKLNSSDNIYFYRIYTEIEFNTIIFILKLFFIDDDEINIIENSEYYFYATFYNSIMSYFDVDKEGSINFLKFENLKEFIIFLES